MTAYVCFPQIPPGAAPAGADSINNPLGTRRCARIAHVCQRGGALPRKTARQDEREWPSRRDAGVMIAGPQKAPLRLASTKAAAYSVQDGSFLSIISIYAYHRHNSHYHLYMHN